MDIADFGLIRGLYFILTIINGTGKSNKNLFQESPKTLYMLMKTTHKHISHPHEGMLVIKKTEQTEYWAEHQDTVQVRLLIV